MTLRNLDGTGCLIGSHRFRNEHKAQLEIDWALLGFCNDGLSLASIYWDTYPIIFILVYCLYVEIIEQVDGNLTIPIFILVVQQAGGSV